MIRSPSAITQLFRLPELIVDRTQATGLSVLLRGAVHVLDDVHITSLQRLGTPIGVSFVGIGILILLTGSQRFFHVQKALIRSVFIPSRIESTFLC